MTGVEHRSTDPSTDPARMLNGAVQLVALGDAARLLTAKGGPWADPSNPPARMVDSVAARLLDPDTEGAIDGLHRIAVDRHQGDDDMIAQLTAARDFLAGMRRQVVPGQ